MARELSAGTLETLSNLYGWADVTSSLIYSGENATFLIQAREVQGKTQYALRKYRARNLSPIRAELAWMVALSEVAMSEVTVSEEVAIPQVLPTRDHTLFAQVEGQTYAAFEYLEGHYVEENTSAHLFRLGQLFSTLHTASEEVAKRMPPDWIGWQRPTFDYKEVVEKPLKHLLTTDFLTSEDKVRCERVAAELRKRFQPLSEKTFIHADLHFGNVLNQRGRWFCLDFDECGFGSRLFDLGVVKFHLMAENDLRFLSDFLRGYGESISDEDLSLGTAARIFYTAGKIPRRLDIPELAREPRAVIQRYLGYLEGELGTHVSPCSRS